MSEKEPSTSLSETRNSKVRELTARTIDNITGKVHEALPWLHPDHLNILGVVSVGVGSLLAAQRRGDSAENIKLTAAAFGLIAGGSLTDAFDGSLARRLASEGKKIDFTKGQVKDAVSDRTQELMMSLSRAVSAHQRGDWWGELAAFGTAVTNSLPSYTRSLAESQGKIVPEAGKGLQGFIGTRVGRAVIGTISTLFPKVGFLPIQPITDTATIIANVVTTSGRFSVVRNKDILPTLSETARKEAQLRKKVLGGCEVIAVVVTIAAFVYLHLGEENNFNRSFYH